MKGALLKCLRGERKIRTQNRQIQSTAFRGKAGTSGPTYREVPAMFSSQWIISAGASVRRQTFCSNLARDRSKPFFSATRAFMSGWGDVLSSRDG